MQERRDKSPVKEPPARKRAPVEEPPPHPRPVEPPPADEPEPPIEEPGDPPPMRTNAVLLSSRRAFGLRPRRQWGLNNGGLTRGRSC